MNCLDFRRQLMADPFSKDPSLLAHEAECPDCAPFARELRADEVRLRSVLKAVTPPEGLAERIQLAARFEQRATVRRRWWYATAASVLLTIGISMGSLFNTSLERGNVALAQSVINHIEDEASHLRAAHPVSDGRLKWVFRRFGAELAADIGPVNFAAECLMRNRNGVHLVIPGRAGPITVFFMPGEMADETLAVDSPRFHGEILPTAWGSIAVVGERDEQIDGLGARLAAADDWPQEAVGESTAASGLLSRGLALRIGFGQPQDS